MSDNSRKATDVLLELESKLNVVLEIVRSQDLNIKILSNKLKEINSKLDKQPASPQKITVEAVHNTIQNRPAIQMPSGFPQMPVGDPERNIPVEAESSFKQETSPQGFRRNSRPETYVDPNKPATPLPANLLTPPVARRKDPDNSPPPCRTDSSAGFPNNSSKFVPDVQQQSQETALTAQGHIPVMQRVVDKNGKSIFLADVDIVNLSTNQPVFKNRTNGTGKWMASLPVGAYRVTLKKRGSSVATSVEAVQDIQVDGKASTLELPMLIVK